MSEKRRSSSIDRNSGSGVEEKDPHPDIVSVEISLCAPTHPSQDVVAKEMQALGPDLLEAIAYVKKMTPEEIEETIDYILNEVLSPLVATLDLSLMF